MEGLHMGKEGAFVNEAKNVLTAKELLQDHIWFENLLNLENCTLDDQALIRWIHDAVFDVKCLDDSIPKALENDLIPRIIFLSVSNGDADLQVVYGAGKGIVNAAKNAFVKLSILKKKSFRPEWLKVDIVDEVVALGDCNFSDPLEHDRSLYGLAFDHKHPIAFLADQLTGNTLVNSKVIIRLNRIKRYLKNYPKLQQYFQKLNGSGKLYRFSTRGIFSEDGNALSLFRGHRLFYEIDQINPIKQAVFAGDYLIDAVHDDGKYLYSYLAKRDLEADKYNMLRHAGTIYAMLELYQVTENEKIIYSSKKIHRLCIEPNSRIQTGWKRCIMCC